MHSVKLFWKFPLHLNKAKCVSSKSEKCTQNRNERPLESSIVSEDAVQCVGIFHVRLSQVYNKKYYSRMHSFSNLGSCTAQTGTRCIWFHLVISLLDRIILSSSVLTLYYNNFDLLIYIYTPCISTSWLTYFVKFNTTVIHQKLEKSEHTDKNLNRTQHAPSLHC